MKEFLIWVETRGERHYIVDAETFEEAVQCIKEGDAFLASEESELVGEFYDENGCG